MPLRLCYELETILPSELKLKSSFFLNHFQQWGRAHGAQERLEDWVRDGNTATCIFNESYPKPIQKPDFETDVIPLVELEEATEEIVLSHAPKPTRKPDIEAVELASAEESNIFKRIFGTPQKFQIAQGRQLNN